MRFWRHKQRLCVLAALWFIQPWFVTSAAGQEQKTTIDAGGSYHHLTANYPAWNGVYFRATVPASAATMLGVEVVNQAEFGERGTYLALSGTHVLNEDWHVFGAAGAGAGGFFYPRWRADGTVNRKWLAKRQLVTSIGGGYYAAKDTHRDVSLSTGAVYYFDGPWIVEGGVRWNSSSPGRVVSRSQFVSLTQGRSGDHYLVFRAGFGREAYQPIGPAASIVDFKSQVFTLTYRKWLGTRWGLNTSLEVYSNPIYRRAGSTLGFFRAF